MSFQPTEKTVPSAQASTGAPSGAKMSSPWCQFPGTSPRKAPNVSTNETGPYTGKTYPPAVSLGCRPVGIGSSGAPPMEPPLPLAFGREALGVFLLRLLAGGTDFFCFGAGACTLTSA